MNPQMIFERARRLYAEKIPELIERERATGKGWDGAAGHLATLGMIGAITDEESADAWERLTAAMQEHLRSSAEEPLSTKSPQHTNTQEHA